MVGVDLFRETPEGEMSTDPELNSRPSFINKRIYWELLMALLKCGHREFTEKVLQEVCMFHESCLAKQQY